MVTIHLNKQQAINADPKKIQQSNLPRNLTRDRNANTTIFFIIEEIKQTILEFLRRTVRMLSFYFVMF